MPRSPIHFGEGLDRESGLQIMEPTKFQDLRNVLLHQGHIQVRPGFLPAGSGKFAEVDQLIAGEPLRSQALGIVVGYNSTSRRVFVYRVSPDLTLVELLGEWEHDLSSGWDSDTPIVHTAEVYGKVFLAHDQAFVSRRAPTIYYDNGALVHLTSSWAGTAGAESLAESLESAESAAESVVTTNAIRFRGVVRHLAYLVGWGFGTAAEPRPELVRISLPGDPTSFDLNHYFIAGDRNDPVSACGPSGTGGDGGGGILNVWKRNETHAIYGYDRRTFGIRLIDARYGIIASRAWINIQGLAIAWTAEGPRAWSGLGASEPLDSPLHLDEWEPSDLAEQSDTKFAYAFFVPRQRVAWFVFGQRVYALTTRIPGQWKWSFHSLGFATYGAVVLFSTTEGSFAPPGYPECGDITAGGDYAEVDVVNHNQVGDEFLEVWIKEVISGSGEVDNNGAGGIRGWTDFSEFDVGSGLPAGLTQSYRKGGNVVLSPLIGDDVAEGHYFQLNKTPNQSTGAANDMAFYLVKVDAWDDVQDDPNIVDDTIEMFGRIFINPDTPVSARTPSFAPCYSIQVVDGAAPNDAARTGQDFEIVNETDDGFTLAYGAKTSNGSGEAVAEDPFTPQTGVVEHSEWWWFRERFVRNGMGDLERYFRAWEGSLADEPATWDFETDGQVDSDPDLGLGEIGFGLLHSTFDIKTDGQRIAFVSFTTDPTGYPLVTEPVTAPTSWELAATVAVSALANQTVLVSDLEEGKSYAVALRYRRGLLYNAGAEDSDDPSLWPSISRCSMQTTANPPTINSATWSRLSAGAEQVELDITPATGLEAEDIEIWRATVDGAGEPNAPTMIDTVAGPHAGDIQYQDTTMAGETAYYYYALTAAGSGDSPLSDGVRAWVGPAAVPVRTYFTLQAHRYTVGFSTTDATLDTELWDNLVDPGPSFPALTTMHLEESVAAGETELDRSVGFTETDDFQWSYKLRHAVTAFAVTDYGEFGPTLIGDWPEGLVP